PWPALWAPSGPAPCAAPWPPSRTCSTVPHCRRTESLDRPALPAEPPRVEDASGRRPADTTWDDATTRHREDATTDPAGDRAILVDAAPEAHPASTRLQLTRRCRPPSLNPFTV